ncbi:MAG: putative UDP-glucuronosyltransferase [Thermoleophilia bacterium]|nr:putative UDP-glucuronosyltransferase [Thermoleophilia bacterium]
MARGVMRSLHDIDPSLEVTIADGLDLVKPGKAASDLDALKRNADLGLGAISHQFTNNAVAGSLLRTGFAHQSAAAHGRYLAAAQPDLVVATFPYLADSAALARARGAFDAPIAVTMIDPQANRIWFSPAADALTHLAPGEAAHARQLGALRPEQQLTQVRPPVQPEFLAQADRAAVRSDFGLPNDRPVVLVSGGATGIGMDEQFVQSLRTARPDVTFAIATGSNTTLARDIASSFSPRDVTAIPFTDRMSDLVTGGVDAALTNSGGMTTMEAIAGRTPVVMHNVMKGHGVDSARAMSKAGLVLYAPTRADLRATLATVGVEGGLLERQAGAARDALFSAQVPTIGDTLVGVMNNGRRATGA